MTDTFLYQANCNQYPVIAAMAKYSLSYSGSSFKPESLFSLAADVCVAGRDRLLVSTIERQVLCQLWLCEGIPLGPDFIKLMEACGITKD